MRREPLGVAFNKSKVYREADKIAEGVDCNRSEVIRAALEIGISYLKARQDYNDQEALEEIINDNQGY